MKHKTRDFLPVGPVAVCVEQPKVHSNSASQIASAYTNLSLFQKIIVPAHGATAATVRNGDFGTSPFFEQLSDEPQLACKCLRGLSDAKRKSGSRN